MKNINILFFLIVFQLVITIDFITAQSNIWELTNSPEGGSLAKVIKNSKGQLFAGTYYNKVFRSDDNLVSWSLKNKGLPSGYSFSSIISLDDDDLILTCSDNNYNAFIYKSTDAGDNWVQISNLGMLQIEFISKGFNKRLFLNAFSSLYYSDDKFNTLVKSQFSLVSGNIFIQSILISPKGYLIAFALPSTYLSDSTSCIFKSLDNGISWSLITTTKHFNLYNGGKGDHAVFNNDGDLLNSTDKGIFLSTDDGKSWEKQSDFKEVKFYNFDETIIFGYNYNGIIYKSVDKGKSWGDVGKINKRFIIDLLKLSDGQLLANVDGLGIMKSNDMGATWQNSNKGIIACRAGPLMTMNGDRIICYFYGMGLFDTTDKGKTWNKTSNYFDNPDYEMQYIAINSKGWLYANNHYWGGLLCSKDNGATWNNIAFNNNDVFYIKIDKNDRIYVNVFTGDGWYCSTNDGISWEKLFIINHSVEGWNYVVNESGLMIFYNSVRGQLIKSTDFGQTWNDLNFPSGQTPVNMLMDDSYNVYVLASPDGLWKSSDIGLTWTKVNSPLSYNSFGSEYYGIRMISNTIVINNKTNDKIYTSSDGALTWKEIQNDYKNGFLDFTIDKDGYIYFGTYNDGVIKSKQKFIDMITDVKNNEPLPNTFSLSQNYPNPFNPNTTITYQLLNSGNVNLSVYNLLGQKIIELVNQYESAGKHEVKYNPQNLSSGVYIYKLRSGEYFSQKKMIYLK